MRLLQVQKELHIYIYIFSKYMHIFIQPKVTIFRTHSFVVIYITVMCIFNNGKNLIFTYMGKYYDITLC